MKKLVTSLALAAVAYTGAQAGVPNPKVALPQKKQILPSSVTVTNETVQSEVSKDENPQALSYRTVLQTASNIGAIFSYFQQTNPLAYDPTSGIMALAAGSLTAAGGDLTLRISTNNGSSWVPRVLVPVTQDRAVLMPQVAISNPDAEKTDLTKMVVIATGADYANDGTGSYPFDNSSTAAVLIAGEDPLIEKMASPDNGSGYSYNTSDGNVINFDDANGGGILWSGRLDGGNPATVQAGQHGVWVFGSGAGDFTVRSVPAKWSPVADVFYLPPGATLGGNYSSAMVSCSDPDGNLYSWIFNVFADDPDFSNRKPAFSKSTDGGKTWSDFQKFPVELYQEYATAQGAANASFRYQYEQNGAVATGNDQTSFFFIMALDDNTVITGVDLVEAAYNKGTWTLRKVATINDNLTDHPVIAPVTASFWNALTQERGGTEPWAQYDESDLAFEIQAARTVDGSDVVLKWVNNNFARRVTFNNPIYTARQVQQQNEFVTVDDTVLFMYNTDVYMATRKGNSSTWSNARNVTDDDRFDKGTKIPPVLASIDKVPLLTLHTVTTGNNNLYGPGRTQFPTSARGCILSASQDVKFAMTDPFNTVSVNDNETVSTSQFSLSAPTPNPAADNFSFSFATQKSGNATITVSDALGRTVATLYDNYLENGTHARNVDASQFASGVYYISLTLEGQTLTKAVSIMR
jgi:hypothetical protein